MFGNIKGWGISALIVVVVCLLIFVFGKPPQISAATRSIPLALAPATLSVDPASLDIKPRGTDVDAHDLYTKVIDDYKANQFKYEKYSVVGKLAADKPEFLQWIVEAGDAEEKNATLFKGRPQLVINYENRLESVDALKSAGLFADNLGLFLVIDAINNHKSFDEADKYLKGAFILGRRLYNERLRWEEFRVGTQLMFSAAYALQKQAVAEHDNARAAQLAAFQQAVNDYNGKAVSAVQVISGIDGNPLKGAGDIFYVAQKGQEPMWRIEATLKLGRMHFMENVTPGDQRGAVRILKEMADDADSLPVRTAAAAGRDLKVEDFRKIGGGS